MSNNDKIRAQILEKKLELLQKQAKEKEELPHLHFDLYPWQEEFIDCHKHKQYLTSANQTGKSWAMMLKAVKMSTDVEWREKQWGKKQPRMGWYLLPDQATIDDNYMTKLEPEILPRGAAKAKGPYAWKLLKKGNEIKGVYFFNTKFTLSFVSLGASATNLQSRSIGFAIFDEEPKDLNKLSEIETRTNSFLDHDTGKPLAILVYGFTPTIGHDYFKRIFSFNDPSFFKNIPEDIANEYFPNRKMVSDNELKLEIEPAGDLVWKKRVNIFDCFKFKSGRPGIYNEEFVRYKLKHEKSKRDSLKRFFGAFEKEEDGGLVYPAFDRQRHIIPYRHFMHHEKVKSGFYTAGIDWGSGTNHSSAICISWISADCKKVRLYKLWKGEKGIPTIADDVVKKYLEMTSGIKVLYPFYDWSYPDLKIIAQRMGLTLYKAEKSHEIGEGLLNTLMNNDMLEVIDNPGDPHAHILASELENITHDQNKKYRVDDLADAVRYSLAGIAHMFNLETLSPDFIPSLLAEERSPAPAGYQGERDWTIQTTTNDNCTWEKEYEDEISEWNDLFYS